MNPVIAGLTSSGLGLVLVGSIRANGRRVGLPGRAAGNWGKRSVFQTMSAQDPDDANWDMAHFAAIRPRLALEGDSHSDSTRGE